LAQPLLPHRNTMNDLSKIRMAHKRLRQRVNGMQTQDNWRDKGIKELTKDLNICTWVLTFNTALLLGIILGILWF
jgi:hypothetical protein